MNKALIQHYSKLLSAFYGVGGLLRLSRVLDAFEKVDKEKFDKVITEVLS